MKNKNLKKMALMGMASGLVLAAENTVQADILSNLSQKMIVASGCATCAKARSNSKNSYDYVADADYDTTTTTQQDRVMSESELMSQLNAKGKQTYSELSPEGKALAIRLASQTCKGKNMCKGLNSCKTKDNNICAGRGSCRGTSPGPFVDKNEAVQVAADKMAEKRSNAFNR